MKLFNIVLAVGPYVLSVFVTLGAAILTRDLSWLIAGFAFCFASFLIYGDVTLGLLEQASRL